MRTRTTRSKYSSSGTIMRLPVFEEDEDPSRRDAMTDEEIYENRKPPTSIVVRYGSMQLVGEYPYDGPAKPGCGSKLVARTSRGLEIVEMLTTTCPNAGCGKSVSRQEMLDYIENSGGEEFPFRTDGKILRVASVDDLNRWSAIQAEAQAQVPYVKQAIEDQGLSEEMSLVSIEPILSQEQVTIYYLAEDRVDFRDFVQVIAREFTCRIEMRQVGARDEARLTADYERCGQHCCCQNFLKVLKPVSMRSAKMQKATLDPLKISGRCGRLMCCLRYEDETYADLKKRLPHRKTRVGTPEGPGIVIDSKILVQLVLVKLESDNREIAVPVEDLCDPDAPIQSEPTQVEDPLRGMSKEELEPRKKRRRRKRRGGAAREQQDAFREASKSEDAVPGSAGESDALAPGDGSDPTPGRKRRKRRRRRGSKQDGETPRKEAQGDSGADPGASPKKKRRRRKRRGSRRGDSPPSD